MGCYNSTPEIDVQVKNVVIDKPNAKIKNENQIQRIKKGKIPVLKPIKISSIIDRRRSNRIKTE